MSQKTISRIFFAITLVIIFGAFATYAVFYKTVSFFIRESVEKTIFWSNLFNRQISAQQGAQ